MTSTDKENMKGKIRALLAKNKENGATEAEASIAIQKAQELMAKYMISQTELEIKKAKCEKLYFSVYPSSYNFYIILNPIAELFDCFHWLEGVRQNQKAVYFGFEEDAQLASYFYEYLCKVAEAEAEKYKKTDEYRKLAEKSHGRTIMASFIRGIQVRLIERIKEQIVQKRKTVSEGGGRDLIVVKSDLVKKEYDGLGLKLQSRSSSSTSLEETAYKAGRKRGDEVGLKQGVKGKSKGKKISKEKAA